MNSKVLKFLTFVTCAEFVSCVIYITSCSITSNSTLGSSPFCEAFNDSKGLSRIGGTLEVLTDLRKVAMAVELRASKNNGQTYDVLLLKGSVDGCTILKGVLGSALVRMFKEKLTKHSNIPMENICPFKKGSYYVKDFPMIDDKFVPPMILQQKRKWKLELTFTAAESKKDKMAFFFKVVIFESTS